MFERSSQGNEKKESENNGFQSRAPALSLPKGGGAIRGMGEKFAANPVTGTGSMTVPIATSPGRSGFGPQLSLSYDSGAGNGWFAFGWSLSLPSITRKTDKGLPRYRDAEESDVFILSGAEDLVPVLVEQEGEWAREVLPPRLVDGQTYRIHHYRPRIEGLFARIERWTNQADPKDTFWRSISKDNITTWYGKTEKSRIADPADLSRIFSWLICESYDDKGNVIVYGYKEENSDDIALSQVHERNRTNDTRKANRYLKRIRYGNHTSYLPQLSDTEPWPTPPGATAVDGSTDWLFEVVLDYGEHHADVPSPNDTGAWNLRNDPFSSYRAGFEVRTYRLCQRVLMFHHFPGDPAVGADCLVRSTDFTYSYEDNEPDPRDPIFSFLLSTTQTGYKREPGGYLSKSLPPLEFEYTQPIVIEEIHEIDPESLENLPSGLDNGRYQWVDLDGEGLSGVLTEQAEGLFYKRNLSPINGHTENGRSTVAARFGPIERVVVKPSLAALSGGGQQLLDLAGDGQLDLVDLEGPAPGFYERTHDERWESFAPFTSLPVLDWDNPNLKFVDLTGDGHADILISEDEVLCWHPSLAEAGFGPPERIRKALDEEQGPKLVFADGTQSIYLADISGDGLTDLVRIRNGEVCYWPNLGYGRFGAKVTMDNAPWFDRPELFDQRRIRLADIDGSGVTDILYLAADGVRLYFNQSGNAWSPPRTLTAFPQVDNLSSVQVADLLGNGTACLIWSSPLPGDARRPMRYLDLMGGQKPHLMVKSVNNLGAETHVRYAPSTKFYLADKLSGKPWITKIPFPVHVVERVETHDRISRNRFVTRYAYHHGYFDGPEREFRGFGMVEQWDTEQFTSLAPDNGEEGGGEGATASNIDAASHVPPVHTRTWFHTGVYVGRDHVSNFFAGLVDEEDIGEYYREPGLSDAQARQLLLDDTVLPDGLTAEEEREACRALKGSMLRQEVYALDGTEEEQHPYTVAEQNFTLRRVQPQAGNRHAVFFTHAREAISSHYERDPADPRLSHALTLEVDEFGNVLKSAAVGYGRLQPDMNLSVGDQTKQTQILITYTEYGVTNGIEATDDYRSPLPSETRTFELTGLTLPVGDNRFGLGELLTAGTGAAPIAYEQSLFAYHRTKDQPDPQPAVVYTMARETHDADPGGAQSKIQHGFSYSDGFGREIQKKIQAEPGPLVEGGSVVSPRWVGSGWTVFNNKGKPVRQYEPFFTDTHRFELDVRIGVSPVLFYDPVERVIATLHPNHTWEKVVFDPWRQETWDVNDTVLIADPKTDGDVGDFFGRLPDADYLPTWHAQRQSGALGTQEQEAARKAAIHAATPTVAHADSLGRTFLTVAHNKFKRSDTPPADPPIEEFYRTHVVFDIEGNQREVIDAKDRVVMRYDYDLLGNRVHQASMEAGERWILNDVAGQPLYAWDSRDHRFHTAYDQLRRPIESYLSEGTGPELLVGRTVYGETVPNPEAGNLRGQVVQLFDQAGIVTSDDYDFKGNLLRSQRQLAREYKTTLDWSAAVPREASIFTSRTRYDALNRPTELTAPDNSVIRPSYNEANLLERMEANLRSAAAVTPFVTDIDYDAKGQRTLIEYGNGVTTTYEYDPLTFRLVHLLTQRDAVVFSDDCPQATPAGWPGCQVQNLRYTFDPVGNITHIGDDAQQSIYFRNRRVELSAEYTNGGTPETTWYVYDAGGQRVRKVTERQAAAGQTPTRMNERIYLGGFEIYREYENDGNTIELEREMLHIMDDQQRIALVETRTQGSDGSLVQLIRYQFGNHLGSASLELDGEAQIISYEEYYPYGSTSYQAVRNQTEAPKRYRYTGKERDEETGFYYHGARYYAPWLGRWTAADPAGIADGNNLYSYTKGSPVILRDSDGMQTSASEGSVLSAVDTTLDRKGLDSNTEVTVRITTKDAAGRTVVIVRTYDRGYFENGQLKLLEGKGKNLTRQQSIDQSIADSWVQKHGGKAEIIRHGGKPPKAHRTLPRKSVGMTGTYDLAPGNVEVVHGNANPRAKNTLQSNNMHVDAWKAGKSGLPDAPGAPDQVRFTQPGEAPRYLSQDDALAMREQHIGATKAEAERAGKVRIETDAERQARVEQEAFRERRAEIEADRATRGGRSIFRRVTSFLPAVGAFSRIMLETQDVSAAETGARIIGSELGIGPFDLELLYDYSAEMYQRGQEELELRQLSPEYDREQREAARESIEYDRKQRQFRPKF